MSVVTSPRCDAAPDVIRTAAAFNRTCLPPFKGQRTFELTGTALTDYWPSQRIISISDDTGAALVLWDRSEISFKAGDRIRLSGVDRDNSPPLERRFRLLETGRPMPAPPTVTAEDFLSGRFDHRPVVLVGIIHDAVRDEIDANYIQLVLNCGGIFIHSAFAGTDADLSFLISHIGTRVAATGLCNPHAGSLRGQFGRILSLNGTGCLHDLDPVSDDPYEVPDLEALHDVHPQMLPLQGRRRVTGFVVAVWGTDQALLRTVDGRSVRITCLEHAAPRPGETIEAVGFPVSDLFDLNLVRSVWRPAKASGIVLPPAQALTARQLFLNDRGKRQLNAKCHGLPVTVTGRVIRAPARPDDDQNLLIEEDSFVVRITLGECLRPHSGIERGSVIRITGICVIDVDSWTPDNPFPRVRGLMIVPRTADDIVIVSRPPWWTPARLCAVIGALMALIVAILIRNRIQKKNAAVLARLSSELKVAERTRLAVELHDSIAQSLTGIALEVNTANKSADTDRVRTHRHLEIAANSLKSCREELRHCLWDLRNNALENADMNEAIRQTLAPHLGDARLTVRFSVPRERISDNTAHAILRIVRELTVNAIRHGQATEIRVAGSAEGKNLLFSVRDNGCGFDPAAAPGVAQGHYGLLGIRERVEGFEGDFEIESAPGKGTRVTIGLNVPQESEKGKRT